MNVLQLIPQLKLGGTERGTVELAAYLVEKGHRAVVISAGGRMVEQLTGAGAVHYQLPVHRKNPWTIFRMIKRVSRIIEKEKIDIVHARSRVPALIGIIACRRTGAEFVTTCHGYYRNRIFSRVMGWGKKVIVASNAVGQHMVNDFKVPRERIEVISRGVDVKKFGFSGTAPQEGTKDGFRVGIIGRITPLKGHRHFLRAASQLVRVVPAAKIVIVGDTLSRDDDSFSEADSSFTGRLKRIIALFFPSEKMHYKEEIERLVHALGLSAYVEFSGVQQDIPEVLRGLDLLVLATTTPEAFGRVIIEAQACGVPVVATSVGGVVDIIEHGETGLLVPPEDSQALASAMVTVYKNPALAGRMRLAARKKVEERYTLDKMFRETLDVYEEVLAKKNILVIKLSALGDVILSIPSLRALRAAFNNDGITLLVDRKFRQVAQRCPYVDEVIACGGRGRKRSIIQLARAAGNIRRKRFDIVVDLQNNRTSHLLGYLSGARSRYGYCNKKLGFFINNRTADDGSVLSPARHQLRVLKLLGIKNIDESLELWSDREDEEFIDALLAEYWVSPGQKLVGVNLGAGSRNPTKRWPVEYYAQLADELAKKYHARVVATGADVDREDARRFMNLTRARPVMTVGRTSVHQLAVLIGRCRVFVTSDSAALHVACAIGAPVIALFGPTDPGRHLTPGKNCRVIKLDLPCSPCYRSSCRHQRCMKEIEVEEVLTRLEDFITDHSS